MTHNPNLSFNMFDTRNPSFFQNSYLLLNLSNCSIWYGKKRTGDKQICARGTGAKGTSDKSTGAERTGDEGTGDKGTGDEGTGDKGTGDKGTCDK